MGHEKGGSGVGRGGVQQQPQGKGTNYSVHPVANAVSALDWALSFITAIGQTVK